MPQGVQFDEWRPPKVDDHKPSKMAQWVINHSGGLVRSESQANRILMILSLIFFAAAAIITIRNFI